MDQRDHNAVVLEGRISAAPEVRVLPSGDEVVALRVVVRRDEGTVDTLPVSVGPAPPKGRRPRPGQTGRRLVTTSAHLPADARVRVEGTLRRRWWDSGEGRRSRIEVVASRVVQLPGEPAT